MNRRRQHKRRTVHNGCAGKVRYHDMNSATRGAKRMLARGKLQRVFVYLCRHGAHYHLSRTRGRDWQREVALENIDDGTKRISRDA